MFFLIGGRRGEGKSWPNGMSDLEGTHGSRRRFLFSEICHLCLWKSLKAGIFPPNRKPYVTSCFWVGTTASCRPSPGITPASEITTSAAIERIRKIKDRSHPTQILESQPPLLIMLLLVSWVCSVRRQSLFLFLKASLFLFVKILRSSVSGLKYSVWALRP